MARSGRELGTGGSFLEKLWEILDEPSNEPYICWQPEGLSFVILDIQDFEANVLTKYFKHSNHNSFVRQLNMYAFVKTCNDSTYREFQNPHFQRARKDLMVNIKRKASVAGAGKETAATNKLTEGQTSRQKAMLKRQEEEEEAAEAVKKRMNAGTENTTRRGKRESATGVTPLMMPSPNLHNQNVSWDPKLASMDPSLNGSLTSPWGDPQGYGPPSAGIADSPFSMNMFRMNSDTSVGEPLLLPQRRNPEGISQGDDFAFSRMNSLDPNNPAGLMMGGRPRSGSTGSYTGGISSGAGGRGGMGVPMELFENTKGRVRELETRNFLLTERFNELKQHVEQLMITLHTYFADTAAATVDKDGGPSPHKQASPGGAKAVGSSSSGNGGFGKRTDLSVNVKSEASSGGGSSPRNTPAGKTAQALAMLLNATASSIGGGKANNGNAAAMGTMATDDDQDHSPAAKALKATLGSSTSTASLGENIAERNTQDAAELMTGLRGPPDARTTEGATNFLGLISSINRNSTAPGRFLGGTLAGQAIVKQASLPASFAPPGAAVGVAAGATAAAPEQKVGSKRPREERSADAGRSLAGQPLKKMASTRDY